MSVEKFRNSKRRILASIIDGVMLSLPPLIIFANIDNKTFALYFFNLYSIIPVLYFVLCNYYYGQTLGKNVLDIKVVDNSTEQNINLKQAILRDSPLIILTILALINFILYYIMGVDSVKGFRDNIGSLHENFNVYWWLLEILTMFTNNKRRAIHDFLAGTVVIRLAK